MFLGYVGDGDSSYGFNGDNDAEVFLETFQDTDNSGKGAFGYLDFLAGLACKCHVMEEDDLLVGFVDNAAEVVDSFVGDVDNLISPLVVLVVVRVHEISEALIFCLVRLDAFHVVYGGAHEDDVVQHGAEVHLGGCGLPEHRGDVGLVNLVFLVKTFAHFFQYVGAGVPDPHGEPVCCAFVYHRQFAEDKILGSPQKWSVETTGRFPSGGVCLCCTYRKRHGKTTFWLSAWFVRGL